MKGNITLLVVLGILAVLVFMGCGSYNNLVQKDEKVQNSWADVQTQYQRRADLIPNLVNTVKGEASFERGTLNDVINARARATSVQVDPSNLNAENIQRFQEAQSQLSGALSRLLVTIERYPTLRANDAFRNLQVQLEGTENRIAVARRDYNNVVRDYNTTVRRFPTNIFAGIMGFDRRPPFEADAGADRAPSVNFEEEQRPQVNFDTTR